MRLRFGPNQNREQQGRHDPEQDGWNRIGRKAASVGAQDEPERGQGAEQIENEARPLARGCAEQAKTPK